MAPQMMQAQWAQQMAAQQAQQQQHQHGSAIPGNAGHRGKIH